MCATESGEAILHAGRGPHRRSAAVPSNCGRNRPWTRSWPIALANGLPAKRGWPHASRWLQRDPVDREAGEVLLRVPHDSRLVVAKARFPAQARLNLERADSRRGRSVQARIACAGHSGRSDDRLPNSVPGSNGSSFAFKIPGNGSQASSRLYRLFGGPNLGHTKDSV
jgi:hypothetical protein